MIKIGLIINPVAGVGGKAGLRGSDGKDIQEKALARGGVLESEKKANIALEVLEEIKDKLYFLVGPGSMGEDVVKALGFSYEVLGKKNEQTSGVDTEKIAGMMKENQVDLLVFAGGDGTARNIYHAIGLTIPAVGIPTGVKIHSAVYAKNPHSAGLVIKEFVENPNFTFLVDTEVMDIDEHLFRENIVDAKLYGYLSTPHVAALMQQSKSASPHNPHDVEGMAAAIKRKMEKEPKDTCYVFGTGGTTFHILETLGFEGSLLGVDVLMDHSLILKDASETELYDGLKDKENIVIIVTIIGGQGHIFGRGNQQISPRVIRLTSKDKIWIVASIGKLESLGDQPLLVDTSDRELDAFLSGYKIVLVGTEHSMQWKIEG